jgi:membrane protease YdiL (CAAX protease family)
MEILLLTLPLLVPIVWANYSERHRRSPYVTGHPQRDRIVDLLLRYGPYTLLVAINLALLAFVGLALLNQVATMLTPEDLPSQALATNWLVVALVSLLTGLLAFLPLIPAVRRWLARWLPIDPASVVHTTALAFAIYQIGLSLGQMALIGDLETLTTTEFALTIWDVVLTGLPLVLVGLAGVGLFVRRNWRLTFRRLGLLRPTWRQLLLVVGITALLLAFDWGVNLAWEQIDPSSYDLVERVTDNIFGNLMTVGGAIALGLSAGISEELLFRGALQPRLGLLLASILFAIGHLQYGLTLAILEVFIIGLALGLIRNRTHTTVCILIHAGYNSVGVFLGLLQP